MAKPAKKKTKAGSKSRPVVVAKPKTSKPAEKPGIKVSELAQSQPALPPAKAATNFLDAAPPRKRPRDVRDMNRTELEGYAMEIGMLKRSLELPDDRLRQNIVAFLQHTRE